MAIVKAPCFSLEARGNVGDICFSRMPSGAVVRSAWSGTQTATTPQTNQRARFSTVTKYWSDTLTPEQRNAWNQAAKSQVRMNRLDIPYRPSGYQYFCQLALNCKVAGVNIPTLPPDEAIAVLAKSFTYNIWFSDSIWKVELYFRGTGYQIPDSADGWQLWRAGPFDGGGRRPIECEWTILQNRITTYYWNDVNAIANKWYYYRARWQTDDGNVGNFWVIHLQKIEA